MEEDETDYRTPIGKVIKHINTLCKKPQIDEQLGEALELFNEKLEEQEKYLINGIFKINFSEAALFLQSSADLYGKKIDLLWDQLLEYHTRLIRYDCEHRKEKGEAIDKAVVEKLEERRNRYKRKKSFKLFLQPSLPEIQSKTSLLFDDEEEVKSKIGKDNCDDEFEFNYTWREIEGRSKEMRRIPNVVYKQMVQSYLLKNYPISKKEDFDLVDPEDGEFITKYSRVPNWHCILHLFEYNNKGLLPDSRNIIAKLRLCAYKRTRFLANRGIPFDTPFEEYEEEYMAYRKQYFEDEAKKWQNMPLDNLEDLRKQLVFLVRKDRDDNGLITTREDNIKLGRYGMFEPDEESQSDKIDLLDNSDDDSLFELSFSCDKEFTRSDLFVRLEKLSSDLIDTKLRQDSGFFDFNSDGDDDDCDNSVEIREITEDGESAPGVVSNDNTVVSETENGTKEDTVNTEATSDVDTSKNDSEDNSATIAEKAKDCADFDDTRSFISDHDYCLTVPPLLEPEPPLLEPEPPLLQPEPPLLETDTNEDMATHAVSADKVIPENENAKITDRTKASKQTVDKPVFAVPHVIPKVMKVAQKKEKAKMDNIKTDDNQLPPKRRKLSYKQIEKLLQSKIKPVKEIKFEKFFSMNYQPQIGEGDIAEVHYESGESDTENIDEFPPYMPDDNLKPSRDDDTQSIMSDHDYCQRAAEDSHNDSGFIDTPTVSPTLQNEPRTSAQLNAGNNTSTETNASHALVEEYRKLIAAQRESGLITDDIDVNTIQAQITAERERIEKERMESQARVEEWRNSITPILRNLKENDFDIHEYGSRIMENLEVNETKSFGHLVQGKPSAEVVRYFISSLQLANTENIEICGAQKGHLSNDTFEVKLLTKDRYHEHLNEYLAPSEETFREKLERVRAMTAANKRSSSGEPAAKKQKLTIPKGKKIKILNIVRKTSSTTSPQHDNIQTVPSLSIQISKDKNIECQLKTSQNNSFAEALPTKEVVQDENNHSLNTYQARILSKGKSIVRRPVMSEKSPNTHLHDIDISMPSTSRQYNGPAYISRKSIAGDQTPSTSSSSDIELSPFNGNYSSNLRTLFDEASPNKRRRDSNEDSFRERLIAVQGMNPDIQMQSTPRGPPPAKQLKTSMSLQKSLLFK